MGISRTCAGVLVVQRRAVDVLIANSEVSDEQSLGVHADASLANHLNRASGEKRHRAQNHEQPSHNRNVSRTRAVGPVRVIVAETSSSAPA